MTGGRVVVLGATGRNFGAGMSGGIAYVLDESGEFNLHCNQETVEIERLEAEDEIEEVKGMIHRHVAYTRKRFGKTHSGQMGGDDLEIREGHAKKTTNGCWRPSSGQRRRD